MKLSQLLASRSDLLRQAKLADAAFAYAILNDFVRRARRARLRGLVRLLGVAPDQGRFAPALVALQGSQAALDEHFDESDLVRLADALVFASEHDPREWEFRIEDVMDKFAAPLAAFLHRAGVEIDLPGGPADCFPADRTSGA